MKKLLSLTIFAAILAFGANGAWAQAAGPFPVDMTNGTFGPAGSVTPNSGSFGGSEYEVYNVINSLLGTSYTNNTQIDPLEYTGNISTWDQTSAGGYSVIGVGAAATNTLDVYNAATPGTLINPLGTSFTGVPGGPVGNGTSSNPYLGTASVFPVGTAFGFALNSVYTPNPPNQFTTPPGGYTWYSNSALNSDSMEHMIAYNLSALTGTVVYMTDPTTGLTTAVTLENPYLLAMDDLPLGGTTGNISDMDFNDLDVLVNGAAPAPVPEPVTVALFGTGLLAMAGFAMRRKLAFISNNWAFIG